VRIALNVTDPVRPKVLRHNEIFAVQRTEPDFDFPWQTADAADCRNIDVAGLGFSQFGTSHDQFRLPSEARDRAPLQRVSQVVILTGYEKQVVTRVPERVTPAQLVRLRFQVQGV